MLVVGLKRVSFLETRISFAREVLSYGEASFKMGMHTGGGFDGFFGADAGGEFHMRELI